MGKISPVASKYIVHASIEIEGVVDRPDVIGAIFGQTEGLLGADLELRELQRSGRIGRIEVNVDTRSGKSQGSIIIPSSLDKAETAIVGAALEVIQRIGPCNARVRVRKIEDVRVSKRNYVIQRAKDLLKNLMESAMPDSTEVIEEVATAVRIMEIVEYGRDRLPAGPHIEETDEVILVEGRADVLNLLKHGFKNAIAMNGTSCPPTIVELTKKKEVTVFVDGDRGGNLIIKELLNVGEIDFVTWAPDGKEVEELAKKEIHKALRSRITVEQAKHELARNDTSNSIRKQRGGVPQQSRYRERDGRDRGRPGYDRDRGRQPQQPQRAAGAVGTAGAAGPAQPPPIAQKPVAKPKLREGEKQKLSSVLESLIGTRGACLLNEKLEVLGKVPMTELAPTLQSTKAYAVVFDGIAEKSLIELAERAGVSHLVAMDSEMRPNQTRLNLVTVEEL